MTERFNLRRARIDKGLTLRELANEINAGKTRGSHGKNRVSHNLLARIEAGDIPRPPKAKAIADFYEVKVSDIWPVREQPEERAA